MGFENRTDKITLAGGETCIVQRIANPGMAAHKIRLARLLPERLAEVGVRAPRVLQANEHATPPFLVREYVEGEVGAGLLATDGRAVQLAQTMGTALPKLARVRTEGLGLNTAWANPARVAAQAHAQLERRRAMLSEKHTALLQNTIEAYEMLFRNRSGAFAHGDFCPINTVFSPTNSEPELTENGQLVLLDLEFARIADRLFDAAWWGWVVRFHHQAQWHIAFSRLLATAGIPDDEITRTRLQTIQHLRLLEALDYNAALSPERGAAWATRLATTMSWPE